MRPVAVGSGRYNANIPKFEDLYDITGIDVDSDAVKEDEDVLKVLEEHIHIPKDYVGIPHITHVLC